MWVAHIAPGLIAKPFVPNVPLWVLALAGALPDAIHFILNLLRIESFNFDPALASKGCFPYSNDYPFTHSLLGMAVAGFVYAGIYTMLTDRRVTLQDQGTIVLTVLSHFFLELPAHRKDVKITPGSSTAFGKGLFDHPLALFILEMAILWSGFLVWNAMSAPFAKAGAIRDPSLPRTLLIFFALEQAYFCFGPAPTSESRFIHAPMFLAEILLNSYMVGMLDRSSPPVSTGQVNGIKRSS
ncbi:hypothetical protein JB92DRAFT_2716243 [Gautieria morchelliformis]|nr:hypothetical protein JB92DRAFT_2716243 [Gautieria morchelliformis]